MAEISLKQLEAFVAVVDCGSFTRAADALFVSQSTVSAHVAALEALLDAPLLTRGEGRAVRPTAEGERVYPMAKKILADCRNLQELFAPAAGGGPLLLAASTVPGQYLVPGYLSAFLQKQPGVRYELRRGDSAQVHRLLADGDARLGFAGAALEPERFVYVPLAEDTLVLAARNDEKYRELKRRGVRGRELLGEPTVARKEGSGTDRSVRNYMSAIGFPAERLNILARVDDPEAIKHMVARGVGVSVLSALAVADEVKSGALLAFEMDEAGLKRQIYLVYRRGERLTETEKRFVSFLKSKPRE